MIEESLGRDLDLDNLAEISAKARPVSEEESLEIAYAELHATREERRGESGT